MKQTQTSAFKTEFFAGNRRRLLESIDQGLPVVVTANGIMQRSADTTFKFRQDSNFWYLTGSNDPDVVLVIDEGQEFLIVPKRDAVLETFEGRVDSDAIAQTSGIKTILDDTAGWERLSKILKRAKRVATLTPPSAYMDFYQFYTNPARATLVAKIQAHNAAIELVDLREPLAKLRVVKQAPELAAIRRAVDATVDGLLYVTEPSRLAAYQYEYEIDADLMSQFRRAGCSQQAFDSIVASGAHGVKMHATENDGPLAHDEMIILDVGAEYSWYAADVARTVMVGEPSKRQQAIYDAVCEAQDYAYSQIKPGVIHIDYERDCARFIGEKLQQLGIIDNQEKETVRRHFPHMMSHFVGLEAHDVGDYKQAMQVGTVMVVEPGMYSFDEGLGVRLEDVVVVTENGYEQLSHRMPRQLRQV